MYERCRLSVSFHSISAITPSAYLCALCACVPMSVSSVPVMPPAAGESVWNEAMSNLVRFNGTVGQARYDMATSFFGDEAPEDWVMPGVTNADMDAGAKDLDSSNPRAVGIPLTDGVTPAIVIDHVVNSRLVEANIVRLESSIEANGVCWEMRGKPQFRSITYLVTARMPTTCNCAG